MIYGIGIDLLRLERMEKVLARHGERLVRRILMDDEIKEMRRRKNPSLSRTTERSAPPAASHGVTIVILNL